MSQKKIVKVFKLSLILMLKLTLYVVPVVVMLKARSKLSLENTERQC